MNISKWHLKNGQWRISFLQKAIFTVIWSTYEEWRELRLSCTHPLCKTDISGKQSKKGSSQLIKNCQLCMLGTLLGTRNIVVTSIDRKCLSSWSLYSSGGIGSWISEIYMADKIMKENKTQKGSREYWQMGVVTVLQRESGKTAVREDIWLKMLVRECATWVSGERVL